MKNIFRIILYLLLALLVLLNYFLLIPVGFYKSFIIYLGIIITIVSIIILSYTLKAKDGSTNKKIIKIPSVIVTLVVIIVAGGTIISSPIFNGKKYRDKLPETQIIDLEQELTPYDEKKTGILPEKEARKIMSTQLSQNGNIGSIVQIGDITKQKIGSELWFVAPLEYNGLFSWINNRDKGTGFIMVNASTKLCKVVDENIKIQPSGYFMDDLGRVLYKKDPSKIYGDFTLELDEELNPYFTATTYTNAVGLNGVKVTGIALVNAITKEINYYTVEETPEWVDRIQPLEYIEKAINYRGKYINGFSPFNDKDKYKSTNGIGIVYNNEKCYYYTGITSLGEDESSLGFYLIDSRTGQPYLYKKSGAIENVAVSTAENKVKNLGYVGTFPLLINIENNLTYFIPLLGSNDLTMSYAFVNVEDPSIVAAAPTINQAEDEYVKYIYNRNVLNNKGGDVLTKEGVINRINSYVQQGNSYYVFTLEGEEKTFVASIEIGTGVALLQKGDRISIEYIDSKGDIANIKKIETK